MSRELLSADGARKYLSSQERQAFLAAADKFPREVRTFCYVLTYTGCRISEALALVPGRVDVEGGVIVFESLKKRRADIFRYVPVPEFLTDMLDMVHGMHRSKGKGQIWTFSRTTAWRHVKDVMKKAELEGIQATPKGLRHSLGVHAVRCNVPLNMLQKWLGHADISTTAIYADALGEEEKAIAARMW